MATNGRAHAVNIAERFPDVALLELLGMNGLPTSDIGTHGSARFFGAHEANRLVGVVGIELHGACGLLRSLAVASEVRGKGTGSALLHHAERAAADAGVAKLYLLTETAPDFFARHGYAPLDRAGVPAEIAATREFAALCPESATCMVRDLREA